MRTTIIDPPSGWKYGFPKPIPRKFLGGDRLRDWLLEQGYPEKDLELAVKHSRYWGVDCEGRACENSGQLDAGCWCDRGGVEYRYD